MPTALLCTSCPPQQPLQPLQPLQQLALADYRVPRAPHMWEFLEKNAYG